MTEEMNRICWACTFGKCKQDYLAGFVLPAQSGAMFHTISVDTHTGRRE